VTATFFIILGFYFTPEDAKSFFNEFRNLEMIFSGIPVPDYPGIQRFLMREFSWEFWKNFAKSLQPNHTKYVVS